MSKPHIEKLPVEKLDSKDKVSFIIKAIDDGWTVKKSDSNSYEFTYDLLNSRPLKNSSRSISNPVTKNDYIKNIFLVN